LGFVRRVGGIALQLVPALIVALMINVPSLDAETTGNVALVMTGLIGLIGVAVYRGAGIHTVHKGR
jgi:hypothetical protein